MIDLNDKKSEELFRNTMDTFILEHSSNLNNIIRVNGRYMFTIDNRIEVSAYYSVHFTDFNMYIKSDTYNTSQNTLHIARKCFKQLEPFFKNDSDFKQAVGMVAGKVVLKEYSKSIYASMGYSYGELTYTLHIRTSHSYEELAKIQDNLPKVACNNANKNCKRYLIIKRFFKDFAGLQLTSRELDLLRYGYKLSDIPERDETVKILRSIFKEDYSIQNIHSSQYDYKCKDRNNPKKFVEFAIDGYRHIYIYDFTDYQMLKEFINTIKLFNIECSHSGNINI